MPTIVLNGVERRLDRSTSVAELLAADGFGQRAVAVEINREIVPKSQHTQRLITEGDCVEIVQAMGGG
jgi:sulfur carrier protein